MCSILKKEHFAALKASQSFYSEETGMIHLSYQARPFKRGDTIPLYHNFLYALALLQNKEKETMQKGMRLIDHLLCFQIRDGVERGAFPRYLHEYPKIERRFEVVDLLLPLYWIYYDFKMIFPENMRVKLLDSIEIAGNYLFELAVEKELSYLLNIQIAALLKALGSLLSKKKWEEKGEEKLLELFSRGSNKSWGSTRHLSKMILFLELLSVDEAPYLSAFYKFLQHTWHKKTHSYLGPGINEHLFQDKQEPTLYHYALSKEFQQKAYSLLEADMMETVLLKNIHFGSEFIKHKTLSYSLYPFDIVDTHLDEIGCSFFNLNHDRWEKRGGFYPFKLLIENKEGQPHSFTLHMGSFVEVKQLSETSFLLTFENLPEKELDISFYGNLSSNVQILSNGKKSTMFDLSAPIVFEYGSYKVQMNFVNKDAGVWAQLRQGNRRSQIIKEFSKTFDWNLYFRKTDKNFTDPLQIQLEIIKND